MQSPAATWSPTGSSEMPGESRGPLLADPSTRSHLIMHSHGPNCDEMPPAQLLTLCNRPWGSARIIMWILPSELLHYYPCRSLWPVKGTQIQRDILGRRHSAVGAALDKLFLNLFSGGREHTAFQQARPVAITIPLGHLQTCFLRF